MSCTNLCHAVGAYVFALSPEMSIYFCLFCVPNLSMSNPAVKVHILFSDNSSRHRKWHTVKAVMSSTCISYSDCKSPCWKLGFCSTAVQG